MRRAPILSSSSITDRLGASLCFPAARPTNANLCSRWIAPCPAPRARVACALCACVCVSVSQRVCLPDEGDHGHRNRSRYTERDTAAHPLRLRAPLAIAPAARQSPPSPVRTNLVPIARPPSPQRLRRLQSRTRYVARSRTSRRASRELVPFTSYSDRAVALYTASALTNWADGDEPARWRGGRHRVRRVRSSRFEPAPTVSEIILRRGFLLRVQPFSTVRTASAALVDFLQH